MDQTQLIQKVEEITDRICNPKFGSCQHGARNYILEPLNQLRSELGLETIENFYVFNGVASENEQKIKKQPAFVEITPEEGWDMIDVLVAAKVFPSKGQARKNWKGDLNIVPGMIRVGRTTITIK
jgi:uncharacterized UPF0160 family protein